MCAFVSFFYLRVCVSTSVRVSIRTIVRNYRVPWYVAASPAFEDLDIGDCLSTFCPATLVTFHIWERKSTFDVYKIL